jgi:hypothetical protein
VKECPKCSKTYDDSWGVCLYHGIKLVEMSDSKASVYSSPAMEESAKKNYGDLFAISGICAIPMAMPFYLGVQKLSSAISVSHKVVGTDRMEVEMLLGMGFIGFLLSTGLSISGLLILHNARKKKRVFIYCLIYIACISATIFYMNRDALSIGR